MRSAKEGRRRAVERANNALSSQEEWRGSCRSPEKENRLRPDARESDVRRAKPLDGRQHNTLEERQVRGRGVDERSVLSCLFS